MQDFSCYVSPVQQNILKTNVLQFFYFFCNRLILTRDICTDQSEVVLQFPHFHWFQGQHNLAWYKPSCLQYSVSRLTPHEFQLATWFPYFLMVMWPSLPGCYHWDKQPCLNIHDAHVDHLPTESTDHRVVHPSDGGIGWVNCFPSALLLNSLEMADATCYHRVPHWICY